MAWALFFCLALLKVTKLYITLCNSPLIHVNLTCAFSNNSSTLWGITAQAITVPSSRCRCSYGTWISSHWSGSWRVTTTMWCRVSSHQMGRCWPPPLMTPVLSCGTTTRAPYCWSWGKTHAFRFLWTQIQPHRYSNTTFRNNPVWCRLIYIYKWDYFKEVFTGS